MNDVSCSRYVRFEPLKVKSNITKSCWSVESRNWLESMHCSSFKGCCFSKLRGLSIMLRESREIILRRVVWKKNVDRSSNAVKTKSASESLLDMWKKIAFWHFQVLIFKYYLNFLVNNTQSRLKNENHFLYSLLGNFAE